jgi:hypothetical protein
MLAFTQLCIRVDYSSSKQAASLNLPDLKSGNSRIESRPAHRCLEGFPQRSQYTIHRLRHYIARRYGGCRPINDRQTDLYYPLESWVSSCQNNGCHYTTMRYNKSDLGVSREYVTSDKNIRPQSSLSTP